MCGVFGIYNFNGKYPDLVSRVRSATDSMTHRGPDQSGYFFHDNIGLGHRRLSIIDIDSGHQPMTNEIGNVIVSYNGEIYNYKEIKLELQALGHCFRTDCDTEVIVHGYEQWGVNCLQRFNGMFAFVLADIDRRQLWVVRDRLGVKPLYYYQDHNVFVVASEIKALLASGFVQSSMNENVLDAYFSVGYVPGPETFFKGIFKVMPGHYLMVQNHSFVDIEYWDFADIETTGQSEKNALDQIVTLLTDSIRKRLVSDVPIGAFLSGGLDSSLVVGIMAKLVHPLPVQTFTIAYHQGFSEQKFAQMVADQFYTNHHVFYLEPENFFSSLESLVLFAEEPLVEPAAIALYHISKLARNHAIVLLSGEGSDEIFAGYALYQFMTFIESVSPILPLSIRSLFTRMGGLSSSLKFKKYCDWFGSPLQGRYRGTSSYLTHQLRTFLYSEDFLQHRSSYLDDCFEGYFENVKTKDSLSQMLYVDTKTWLADNLLVKADKMTMAASVELRVPFLDYRLVEAVTALPSNLKINGRQGKYLVKKLAEAILPHEIIYREKKGFPVPTQEWFKGELLTQISEIIMSLKKEPWFKGKALDHLLVRHKTGVEDCSRLLMTLLVFAEWKRQYA